MTTTTMPELPEPELGYIETDKSRQPAFSARQMREALQSAQPAAAVSDEAICAVWTQHCQTSGTTTRQLVCGFARAIPALSPAQQAPEWDGGEPANLQAAARDADEWLALIQRLNDAGRWLFSQPDSRSKLDGCRAALSKILCAPAQQATPEPVGEPVARVELMQTGGNAGLATRIVEIDDPLRERLRPGDVLYDRPAPGVPEGLVLMPVEPTQAMLDALHSSAYLPGCYRAMLAAAQAKGSDK